jgi:5'-3' exonuclease
MNQQRARRFRTALDVENAREKAIRDGKEMPKEEAFDSNAITPGRKFLECQLNRANKHRHGIYAQTNASVEVFHQQESI